VITASGFIHVCRRLSWLSRSSYSVMTAADDSFLEAESTPGHMELSDVPEKIPSVMT
jgi:hypothetical protein